MNSDDEILASMLGRVFTRIEGCAVGSEETDFIDRDGRGVRFFHQSDCCESVDIVEVIGDVEDLIGSPILQAEEVSSDDAPAPEYAESYTWTFYKFATIKGAVTVRWLGRSNGYYSERVCVEVLP